MNLPLGSWKCLSKNKVILKREKKYASGSDLVIERRRDSREESSLMCGPAHGFHRIWLISVLLSFFPSIHCLSVHPSTHPSTYPYVHPNTIHICSLQKKKNRISNTWLKCVHILNPCETCVSTPQHLKQLYQHMLPSALYQICIFFQALWFCLNIGKQVQEKSNCKILFSLSGSALKSIKLIMKRSSWFMLSLFLSACLRPQRRENIYGFLLTWVVWSRSFIQA